MCVFKHLKNRVWIYQFEARWLTGSTKKEFLVPLGRCTMKQEQLLQFDITPEFFGGFFVLINCYSVPAIWFLGLGVTLLWRNSTSFQLAVARKTKLCSSCRLRMFLLTGWHFMLLFRLESLHRIHVSCSKYFTVLPVVKFPLRQKIVLYP